MISSFNSLFCSMNHSNNSSHCDCNSSDSNCNCNSSPISTSSSSSVISYSSCYYSNNTCQFDNQNNQNNNDILCSSELYYQQQEKEQGNYQNQGNSCNNNNNNSSNFNNKSVTNSTTIQDITINLPFRPRNLVPTYFRCSQAIMEILLSIEYYLDVVCRASYQFMKDKCKWEAEVLKGSLRSSFFINIYQEDNIPNSCLIEVISLSGDSELFYSLFNSLKLHLLTSTNQDSFNQMEMLECEEDDFYLPSLPSSPSSPLHSSILLTEDTNEAIQSLVTMIQSPMICMRIESLKIFVEILSEHNLSNDRIQIVEALYKLNILRLFVENFIYLADPNNIQYYQQSDLFFEFHLLTLIISNIIKIQISHENDHHILYTPTFITTLYHYTIQKISHPLIEQSIMNVHNILQELIRSGREKVIPILGQLIVNQYLSVQSQSSQSSSSSLSSLSSTMLQSRSQLQSSQSSQKSDQITRRHSRSPPLYCAT